jgi:hypothetical protein
MALDRNQLSEVAPLLRRVVALDASSLARLRRNGDRLSALVRLPFGVLAARTLDEPGSDFDVTVRSDELLAWLDGERTDPPQARDADWRGSVPPVAGWRRVDIVPDSQIRPLVRSGALTLKEAAEREGVPGASPRAEVADALLDSVVLTVRSDTDSARITLRTVSAVTRLGFLPRNSHVAVDVSGRWIRVAAAYGSVFAEQEAPALTLR